MKNCANLGSGSPENNGIAEGRKGEAARVQQLLAAESQQLVGLAPRDSRIIAADSHHCQKLSWSPDFELPGQVSKGTLVADSNYKKEENKDMCVGAKGGMLKQNLFQQKYVYFLLIISIKYKSSQANPV